MNELIEIMAQDMNIQSYKNEPDDFFEYRIIYSALGLWCLKSALAENECKKGISKKAQSLILHNLVEKFVTLSPETKKYLTPKNFDLAVFIRNLYEQTGYLLTDDNNRNTLNGSRETISVTDSRYLFLGLPETKLMLNGLGIYSEKTGIELKLKDFLIRDSLTPEEYLMANFDECDFAPHDFNFGEIEFFNPFYYGNISKSWHKRMKSDITMARNYSSGTYYRVIKKQDGSYLFKEDRSVDDFDALTGAEFRRIYVALKKHYDNPMQLLICPIDETYTHIRILGQLPNREYFYLLLSAWPKNDFVDRNNFIIRNELVPQISIVLRAIGFTERNGEFYG